LEGLAQAGIGAELPLEQANEVARLVSQADVLVCVGIVQQYVMQKSEIKRKEVYENKFSSIYGESNQ
jgi:hypothetical protein